MKKFLLVCGLFVMAMGLFADDVRRVAILETVDRQGNVSYASKLMLRSNLAKAITNTPGYEAYDRTDMDAIMGEQDFQRTGMVSNDQIKRLGEMTGAKYVLVAEAVIVDANNMYITAKLLDVETARTVMTDNQLMGNSAKEIQRGCQLLAEKLIKPAVMPTTAKPVKQEKPEPTKQERPKQEKQEKPAPAPQPAPTPVQYQQPVVYNQPTPTMGMIVKISNNEYRLNGNTLDRKEFENFIYLNCSEAYKKYSSGKKIATSGWVFLGTGLGFLAGGAGAYAYANTGNFDSYVQKEVYYDLGMSFMCISGILGTTGIIMLPIGYLKQKNAYDVYNKKCSLSSTTPILFNLTAGQNGIGIAMNF